MPASQRWMVIAACVTAWAGGAVALQVETCDGTNEYFDRSYMACRPCDTVDGTKIFMVPDPSHTDAQGNPTACKCAPGYILAAESDTVCSECPADQVASQDRRRCLGCDAASQATLDSAARECKCPDNFRLSEFARNGSALSAQECAQCPVGRAVFPAIDPFTCASCSEDPAMSFNAAGECVCDTGFTKTGVPALGVGWCLLDADAAAVSSFSAASAAAIPFRAVESSTGGAVSSIGTVSSIYAAHYFLWAAATCTAYRTTADLAACQTLGNLCVMHHYDDSAAPCQAFDAVLNAASTTAGGQAGWRPPLPWLVYSAPDSKTVTQATGIQMQVAFKAGDGVTRLQLKVAAFHLNGTYAGTQDFAQLLEYCANKTLKSPQQLHTEAGAPRWLQFGVTTQSRVQCDLRTLLASGRGGFYYDPYLVDEGDGGTLVPVPVRVENVAKAGTQVNAQGGDASDDVFTRRFTLFDVFAGTEQAGSPPSVVRYLERAVLRVSIQEEDASRIYPPLLSLRYRERLLSSVQGGGAGAEATVDVRAVYTMPTDGLQRTSTAFLVVGIVVLLLAAVARYFVNSRAATAATRGAAADGGLAAGAPGVVTTADIGKAALHLCTLFARTFFVILFAFTFVVFLFFKAQGTVFFLLPEDDPDAGADNEYHPFLVLLVLCWACQVIRVLSLLYNQCRNDIFFLDWEKPRGTLGKHDAVPVALEEAQGGESSDEEHGHSRGAGRTSSRGLDSRTMSRTADSRTGSGRARERKAPVSVWRTFLAANQWCDIQTQRQLNATMILIVLIVLLDGANLKFLATPQPDGDDLTPDALNPALRFANTTTWWLVLATGYWLWTWAVRDRFITEPPHEMLVDLCTMAKVSVFILDAQHHGYYLHCRSPYQHADGDMVELADQLRKEEMQQLTGRGLKLRGCPDGVQTFEMYLSPAWRSRYDKIFRVQLLREHARQSSQGATGMVPLRRNSAASGPRAVSKTAPAALLRASHRLRSFLKSFVNQTDPNYPMEYRPQTALGRSLRVPPEGSVPGTTVMLADTGRVPHFTSAMFYGVENDLLLLDVLTFAVFDWWTGSSIVAALLVFLQDQGLAWARAHYGTLNVAAKTLVDERFLI